MGLFNLFKKSPAPQQAASSTFYQPYKESATNYIYNILFCDDLSLYQRNQQPPYSYPFNILFSESSSTADLQKLIDDTGADPRVKILASNLLLAHGHKPAQKELFAIIVEVGLEQGLDTLASFHNGTARYINQSGKIVIWESTTDAEANAITAELFSKGEQVIKQIGPWDKPRRPQPAKGMARISFLVSDGLYFGEAPLNTLFNDPLASPALMSATQLMQYLMKKSLEKGEAG